MVPEPGNKTVFFFVGRRGGIGKTLLASNLISWLRFRCSPAVAVRGFDLDRHGPLSRFYGGLERVGDFQVRELLGLVVADTVHSCFVVDGPGASETLLESVFSGYRLPDSAFRGIRVVLVVPVSVEGFSLSALPWVSEFAGAQIVLVYRKPGPGIGAEIRDSADLGDLALPLWLQIAGGNSGDRGAAGESAPAGADRVKRMLQPQFKPEYLVEHLFNRGISLYQASYPYSARAARELPAAEVLVRKQQINSLVGEYWGARKKYWGVGFYYGYQLTVYLGFLYRQLAMVFGPLLGGAGGTLD